MSNRKEYVDVIKFQKRCDPIRDNCWGLDCPITQKDVETAVNTNILLEPKVTLINRDIRKIDHIARIAWFVVNGWNDPIDIDVGVPSLGCYPKWPLEDGNHRLAAAIIRGDRVIPAYMSGSVNEIQKFLERVSIEL